MFAILRGLVYDRIWIGSDAGAPTDGAAGTGPGKAGPGSIYIDKSTGQHYRNIGTEAAPVWNAGGETFRAQVILTNAEVLALRAAPKTLVAAPGAGKTLEFLGASLFFDETAVYTAGAGDDMAVKYNNGAGVAVSDTIEATGFLTAAADTKTSARPKLDPIVSKAGSENQALVLHNVGGAEFGGGNAANRLIVDVLYRVVNVTY